MKLVLVASDLSERSDKAVARALQLAQAHGAACHVLHVVDEDLPADFALKMRDAAAERLAQVVAPAPAGATVTTEAVIGDPIRVIAQEAHVRAPDLVVFGTHRPRAFLDLLRETTVERLVRLIAAPALVVRNPAEHAYARVLVPVSFSPACGRALELVRRLLPDAQITAFHAVYLPFTGLTHEVPGGPMDREMTAEAEAVRAEWCAAEGLPDRLCDVVPITGSLGAVMDQRIATVHPDLIALGAHTRGRLAPHKLGSFAAELLRTPPTDLLIAA